MIKGTQRALKEQVEKLGRALEGNAKVATKGREMKEERHESVQGTIKAKEERNKKDTRHYWKTKITKTEIKKKSRKECKEREKLKKGKKMLKK